MKQSAKKPTSSKGRRYTMKERKEIISFVEKVNEERGRGGQNAASKKFGVSPLTISVWLSQGISGGASRAGVASASLGKKLQQLQQLHDRIVAGEAELAKLRAQFDAVRNSL